MFVFNNSEKTTSNKIDVCDLEGYTCIVCTNVVGEFEGADFDKPVKLDNGMIFEFNEYNYTYSYRPEVAVFASTLNYQSKRLTVYKLWIEDEVYDVTRIR
jgi:hypothetical protein